MHFEFRSNFFLFFLNTKSTWKWAEISAMKGVKFVNEISTINESRWILITETCLHSPVNSLGKWEKNGEKKPKWPTKNFMIGSFQEWSQKQRTNSPPSPLSFFSYRVFTPPKIQFLVTQKTHFGWKGLKHKLLAIKFPIESCIWCLTYTIHGSPSLGL